MGGEAANTLTAMQAGDYFLFSNHRQRYFYMGLLAMAGVDLRREPGAVVPLCAPDGPPRRVRKPHRFIMGGVYWPWQDPMEALGRAREHLARRGDGLVVLYGGPPVLGAESTRDLPAALPADEHLEYRGMLPYHRLLEEYSQATAALDVMSPGPERSLAMSFRHMDYLGCGLPMITTGDHALAHTLRARGAALVDVPVEQAIDLVLDDPRANGLRSRRARELARSKFSRQVCEAPLLRWLESPTTRERRDSPMGSMARLWTSLSDERVRIAAMEVRLRAAESEVAEKRLETVALVEQIHRLTETVSNLSGAVAEVAGFKREAIDVLDRTGQQARHQARNLGRELSIARADLAKKNAELRAMEDEKRRLENDLVNVRQELERSRRGLFRR